MLTLFALVFLPINHIKENNAITAEKERINAELDLAAKIQADMLPAVFPAFSGRKEFDLYASMTPAKEVGGDFYDFFMIDEDTLVLVIADVSEKGVPAAMFMMRTMLMIESMASQTRSPSSIIGSVNNKLCDNNDSGMPFDPLAKKEPDIKQKASRRKEGGLGTYISRKFLDHVHYVYKDGHNTLTITKKLES